MYKMRRIRQGGTRKSKNNKRCAGCGKATQHDQQQKEGMSKK